jgi:hypothetical protein
MTKNTKEKKNPGTIYGCDGTFNTNLDTIIRHVNQNMYYGKNTSQIITEYVPVKKFKLKTALEEVKE